MVSFLNKVIFNKNFTLNYAIFTITLAFTPLLQAQCRCTDSEHKYERTIHLSFADRCPVAQAICKLIGNINQRRSNCETSSGTPDPEAKEMCRDREDRNYKSAVEDLNRLESEARQNEDRSRRECQREQRELSRIKLPPGCQGRSRRSNSCRTDAEKCRDVQQRLGIASALTPTLQNALASDCPQLAKAKYDDDQDRLDKVTDDQRETLENIWELQADIRENDKNYQEGLLKSQEDIQRLTTQITTATTEFEGQISTVSNEISKSIAEMKNTSTEINQDIRRLSRRLNELQTDNNPEADEATIEYRRKIRQIFARCNGGAGQAVQRLRGLFQAQAASGTVTKLSDATEENRQERLRQTAIRAYAKCRNSQETENEIAEAAETYEMQQRARIRLEGEIIDQIETLQERLENLSVESENIVTSGDKAFETAHEQHVSQVQELNTQLQMAQFQKEQLLSSFQQQQTAMQEKLKVEQPRLQKLNGEMLALEQSVAVGKPASLFANLSHDNFQTLDEYTNQFDIAQSACCGDHIPGTVQKSSGICGSNNVHNFLQRRGRGTR